jgi:iron uptake system component EfeO
MATATDSVAAYRVYLETNTDLLVQRTKSFVDAVVANKLTQARNLYAQARYPYEAIEPVAESFGDLDPQIDARENDVPVGATWTGFHRIEKALWVSNSTAGMAPTAHKLLTDVTTLQDLVKTVQLDPATIANGAVGLLNEVSSSKITGEEDRYSHTDLSDVDANVVGSQAAFNAVRPLVVPRSPALAATIDQRFADVLAALAPFKKGTAYVPYTTLTASDTQNLSTLIDALGDPLSQVAAIVVAAN